MIDSFGNWDKEDNRHKGCDDVIQYSGEKELHT